jgi:hypothetical protein
MKDALRLFASLVGGLVVSAGLHYLVIWTADSFELHKLANWVFFIGTAVTSGGIEASGLTILINVIIVGVALAAFFWWLLRTRGPWRDTDEREWWPGKPL